MNGLVIDSIKGEKKYSKLLSNLLFIKSRDQAIFTKVNNTDSFDITTKFGRKISDKILSQKKFTFNLSEVDLEEILKIVETSESAQEIIEIYDAKKERLFNTKKLLLESPDTFTETKKELIENLNEKIQKSNNRWMQFRRKVIDANIQDNIWILHVATFFVSIKTVAKTIYAPFILKEVSLTIENNKILLSSETSWKINEKLLFFLNENNFSLNEKMLFEDKSGIEIIHEISQQLNLTIDYENLSEKFINLKPEDINNKNLVLHNGLVLGLFKPSGGHIRKTMLRIIENDEVDSILDPEPDKNVYENKLNDFLKNRTTQLLKIQKSNFSQERALASALMQDTIIWGPPGTGKSQVIANIIANILYQNKTAVVMSQKKAALDVLKKRLGKVSAFCLFILNDNKMDKKEFYYPLQNFINLVENSFNDEQLSRKPIISKKEIESIELLSKSKEQGSYGPSLELIEKLLNKKFVLEKIFYLNNKLNFPNQELHIKEYMSLLAKNNNIQKQGIFFLKRYPYFIKENSIKALEIIDTLNSHNENQKLNSLIELSRKTNYDTVSRLLNLPENLVRKSFYNSDEMFLVNFLSKQVLAKIRFWKQHNQQKFIEYKKFANAVRAARSLPYKLINNFISIIRELFPIIITNPETSFINWEKEYFDYAILDESSQMFLETGLPILYLAKIKVLAGDTKQMQPSHWFLIRNDEISEEEDVVENAESLLDYAFDKGTFQVMLNQNFRSSSASLMSFSAKQFYESKLEVIDKNSNFEKESIIIKNVNGKWQEGINEEEVKEVIKTIYQEKEFYDSIIVLAFNFKQRQLIEKEIIEKHPEIYQLIENEKLSIKNIENIQGDEADLVIASIVYDSTTNMSSTYVCREGGSNALNVAISRARYKMIIIKSITINTIKSAKSENFQIFKNWLKFLDMNESEKRSYSVKPTGNLIQESYGETESNFERDVINEIKLNIITPKKVKLIKQYEVGSKRIDIAFVNSKNKYLLGIEVDGYLYHNGINKYLEDISRQDFLEFKGYQIYRIKEIDWVIRKEKILKEINFLLNQKL